MQADHGSESAAAGSAESQGQFSPRQTYYESACQSARPALSERAGTASRFGELQRNPSPSDHEEDRAAEDEQCRGYFHGKGAQRSGGCRLAGCRSGSGEEQSNTKRCSGTNRQPPRERLRAGIKRTRPKHVSLSSHRGGYATSLAGRPNDGRCARPGSKEAKFLGCFGIATAERGGCCTTTRRDRTA